MNSKLQEAYRKLLQDLNGKKYSEADNNTTVFTAIKGKDEVALMVVGRATNGWGVYYNREKLKKTGDHRNGLEWVIAEMEGEIDLAQVIQSWTGKYAISRSQFWRVSQRIAKSVLGRDENVFDNILYSNLYKVASDGKNPSQGMINATCKNCIDILNIEIEIFKPKKILFLTGYEWAKPFFEDLKFVKTKGADSSLVSFAGKYGDIDVVVAVHPQGKNEDEIVKEIRSAFSLTIPV
jgi:hypothetical protein